MKLLIAYDGSPGADAALADLRRAGLPETAEARVLSIAEVFLPPPGSNPSAQPDRAPEVADFRAKAMDRARDLAEEAKRKVSAMFPRWNVEALARADSPAWGIIKEADSWQPDLVVVGSQGRSKISRFLLGSVSHKVLTESRSTVRVARSRPESKEPIRILVGIDGSAGSDAALRTVLERNWPSGTELLLEAVQDPRMLTGLLPNPFTDEPWPGPGPALHEERIRTALAEAERNAQRAGLSVTSVLEAGDPKERLVERAKAWSADCIFLGARGLTGMDRFLLGSVSSAVAMRAPCSVEIVHGPAFH